MRYLNAFAILLLVTTISMGYSGGPPNGVAGNPPGNANCTQCHQTFPVNSGNGALTLSGLPTAGYQSNVVYHLTLTIDDPGQSRWGFELTPIYQSPTGYLEAGVITVTQVDYTQLSLGTGTQPDYLKHTSTGTFPGTAGPHTWQFDWTAPNTTTGNITFYIAGNAANNNGGSNGDYIYTSSYTVQPAAVIPTLDLSLSPVNPPIQIPATGGTFSYNISITNNGTTTATTTVWNMITLPTGSNYGPVFGPFTVTLAHGGTIARVRNQSVPASAPSGTYTYRSYIGTYPATVVDSANFTFTKSMVMDGGKIVDNWDCRGEAFPGEDVSEAENPSSMMLKGAYPNPFNPETSIAFELPETEYISLAIYDIQGKEVALLLEGSYSAGEHRAEFNAENLPSGVYFARLQVGNNISVQKLLLMK